MNKEIMLKYEKIRDSAENCNFLIWTVFSVGVAFSLWILFKVWPSKSNLGPMYFIMSILGLFVLFYCILMIESLGQKKSLMYKIFDNGIKGPDLKNEIGRLPFFRTEWLAEIILILIFLMYVYLFWFILDRNSLETYGEQIIFLAPVVFIISLILFLMVLYNWISRPKSDGGNFLEIIRKFLFGNWLRSYDEIINKK